MTMEDVRAEDGFLGSDYKREKGNDKELGGHHPEKRAVQFRDTRVRKRDSGEGWGWIYLRTGCRSRELL